MISPATLCEAGLIILLKYVKEYPKVRAQRLMLSPMLVISQYRSRKGTSP